MMIFRYVTLLGILLAPLTADAEPRSSGRKQFHAGGKLGGGLTTWRGDDADSEFLTTENQFGFSVGVFATISLDKLFLSGIGPLRLAVQSELFYATRGAKIEIGASTGSYDLDYITVAVLPRVEYALGRLIPYLSLGPELGYLLTGEIVNSAGNATDITDDFRSADLGLAFELGTEFPLSNRGAVVLELRTYVSLMSIDGQGDGDDIKNQTLGLMLGYRY